MNSWQKYKKVLVFGLMVIIALTISSCAGQSASGKYVEISSPGQGDEFEPGSAVPFSINFMEGDEVAEVIIRIGEEILYQGPPPPKNDPVFDFNQGIIPGDPTDITIAVDVYDADGIEMESALVEISVGGILLTQLPDLAITDIQLEGLDRIECHYANEGGAVLPEGRDVWIDAILGPGESEVPPFTNSNIGVGSSFPPGITGWLTTAPISPVPSWPHLVTCRIDPANEILESDETNNSMTVTLGQPPLAPVPLYAYLCTINQNAFGRFAPDMRSKEVFVALEGDKFEAQAISEITEPYWLFGMFEEGEEGWMSELVLDCGEIDLKQLVVREAPDFEIPAEEADQDTDKEPDACSSAPDDETCKREGGKWNSNTNECDCP